MNEQNKVEELQKRGAKLKACNDRSYARMAEINRIASETLVKTTHAGYEPGQYGNDYRTFGKAICEIRSICKKDLSGDFPDYEWMAGMMMSEHFEPERLAQEIEALASEKPVDYPTFYTPGWLCDLAKKLGPKVFPSGADGTAPAEDDDKAKRQAEYFRRKYSFCDGLFPIRYTNTEDGVMASCWITGRRFTMDLDNNERDDGGHDCAAVIKDNGKVVATIETQRGKSVSARVCFAAFKAYVMDLSGSGKFRSRGGYLKQAFRRENQALIDKELA